MKAIIHYSNGKSQTIQGVETMESVNNNKAIIIDHAQGVTRFEPPQGKTHGVVKIEIEF